jgi:hypothetical protein
MAEAGSISTLANDRDPVQWRGFLDNIASIESLFDKMRYGRNPVVHTMRSAQVCRRSVQICSVLEDI